MVAVSGDEVELLVIDKGFVIVVVISPAQDGSQVRGIVMADGAAHDDFSVGKGWSQHTGIIADAIGGTRDLPFARDNRTVLRGIHIAAPLQAVRSSPPEDLIRAMKGVIGQRYDSRGSGRR